MSCLNSKINNHISSILCPTTNYTTGDVRKFLLFEKNVDSEKISDKCIKISKQEWDSRETSWDFTTSELLKHKTSPSIKDAYDNYCNHWREQFFQLHRNEEELNRIFIDIYDLADELTPDVPLEDITILKDESEIIDGELVFKKDIIIKQFLSYAVGCMFGRYSPDKPGLILANQGEKLDDFTEKVPDTKFFPDAENIIPILDDEYFTDDIVTRFREFLAYTFGDEKISENLDFIADAISSGNSRKTSEEIIRDYFLRHFFKDHCRTYKKRPIYWLFTSGKKKAFNALIYMHRYDKTTLARMRQDYLHELESKFQARLDMLEKEEDERKSVKERKKLRGYIEEMIAYDEVLKNRADEYIEIDLDDGVKVNYGKFGGLVQKI